MLFKTSIIKTYKKIFHCFYCTARKNSRNYVDFWAARVALPLKWHINILKMISKSNYKRELFFCFFELNFWTSSKHSEVFEKAAPLRVAFWSVVVQSVHFFSLQVNNTFLKYVQIALLNFYFSKWSHGTPLRPLNWC